MPQWPIRVEADGGHLLFISVGPMACQPNLVCAFQLAVALVAIGMGMDQFSCRLLVE